MPAAASARFAARPAIQVIDQLADALDWPRSRPARLLAGDRASTASGAVLCSDESALAALDAAPEVVAILATPPTTSDGHLGRRVYDPFAGSDDDVSSWRRAPRVVLDASLPLAGGRGGFDRLLAEAMGCIPRTRDADFEPARAISRDVAKFVGFVPTDALDSVRDAVFDAGAGTIGEYDRCSWSTIGTGTFRGGDGTNPTVGTRGEFEQVEEVRFETIVPTHLLDQVRRAFIAAHPYEEPAYDIYALDLPAPVGFGVLCRGPFDGLTAAGRELGELGIDSTLLGDSARDGIGHPWIVHVGPLRDVLDAVLADDSLHMVVVTEASDAEVALVTSRECRVLVVDRRQVVDVFAAELAARLSRALELPVHVHGGLQFPTDAAGVNETAASSEPSVFDGPPAGVDYAAGTWRLHFDGGSRGNPGPAAYGWVLYDPDGIEHEADGVTVGSATNNVAEWTGLLRGLEHARARGITSLEVRGDSELVVKQVTGVYKVKNAALKPLAEQVAALAAQFDHLDVQHVYRTDNARADALANEALDGLR